MCCCRCCGRCCSLPKLAANTTLLLLNFPQTFPCVDQSAFHLPVLQRSAHFSYTITYRSATTADAAAAAAAASTTTTTTAHTCRCLGTIAKVFVAPDANARFSAPQRPFRVCSQVSCRCPRERSGAQQKRTEQNRTEPSRADSQPFADRLSDRSVNSCTCVFRGPFGVVWRAQTTTGCRDQPSLDRLTELEGPRATGSVGWQAKFGLC